MGKNFDKETLRGHCKTCHFSKIYNENMECHYNAPQQVAGSGTGYSAQLWPHVLETDYCCQWYDKELTK